MGSLQIIANKKEYKIFDSDENQMLFEGINGFRNALTIYEKLISLKESAIRYNQKPCKK